MIDCPICGEKIKKQYHYGGLACESCTFFFRRNVRTLSKKSQTCRTGTKDCLLLGARRNNCPFCRLQKCIKNGMNPKLVPQMKRGNYTANELVKSNSDKKVMDFSKQLEFFEKLLLVLKQQKLILSQTYGINLMAVPRICLQFIMKNVPVIRNQDVTIPSETCSVSEIEISFLVAKESFLDNLKNVQEIDGIQKLQVQLGNIE